MAKIEIDEPSSFASEASKPLKNICTQLKGYRDRADKLIAEAEEHIREAEKLLDAAFSIIR